MSVVVVLSSKSPFTFVSPISTPNRTCNNIQTRWVNLLCGGESVPGEFRVGFGPDSEKNTGKNHTRPAACTSCFHVRAQGRRRSTGKFLRGTRRSRPFAADQFPTHVPTSLRSSLVPCKARFLEVNDRRDAYSNMTRKRTPPSPA